MRNTNLTERFGLSKRSRMCLRQQPIQPCIWKMEDRMGMIVHDLPTQMMRMTKMSKTTSINTSLYISKIIQMNNLKMKEKLAPCFKDSKTSLVATKERLTNTIMVQQLPKLALVLVLNPTKIIWATLTCNK